MTTTIDAATLKAWLSESGEMTLLDVREAGQFGDGHLFFAVPAPYSRFELILPALVPNPTTRMVLCDGGEGDIAARAAKRAHQLGYRNVCILEGGTKAWARAGYTIYQGVNVPSKTFGELVEHANHTPRVTAQELEAMRRAGENFVIVDGRPFSEYNKMNIPGGICCPNGELVLRIGDIVPDAKTKIVVNCAGRTRSIIGAEILRTFGIANPVCALENGTQGWTLAGLELERGANRRYPERPLSTDFSAQQQRARTFAAKHGVASVAAAQANDWLADASRTTYLLDVRTAEEFAVNGVAGFAHAPGGQLVQATDQWVGVKGARIVLVDDESVRAPVVAAWLRQLGHDACVLEGGVSAAAKLSWSRPEPVADLPEIGEISPRALDEALRAKSVQLFDLRPAMAYRAGHIPQAHWSIRPRITSAVEQGGAKPVVLVADEPNAAALAALDLGEGGRSDVRMLVGGMDAWTGAGLPVTATPDLPPDAECIDFLFFTHGRHEGNAEAARQYLAWETGLIAQLDAQERGVFRI